MADVSAIFFILLILGIAFPAMLTAWWLFFPTLILRAQTRLDQTPAQTFWLGLVILIGVTIPLWSSYLVRVYAWMLILAKEGILSWFINLLGLDGALDWLHFSPDVQEVMTHTLRDVDAFLMGRITWEVALAMQAGGPPMGPSRLDQ